MYPCALYLRNISGPPTIEPSDYRVLALSNPRIIGPTECRDPRINERTPLNLMDQSLLSQGKDGGEVKFSRVFKHHIYILTVM